jgi:hypothetical protein
VLLQLDQLPEEATALALGEWSTSPERVLHSILSEDQNPRGQAVAFHRRGSIGMVLQIPHY